MILRRVITSQEGADKLCLLIKSHKMPFTVSIAEGGKRTLDQSALLHMWFGEVARQSEDRTLVDVKADANVIYGIPILSRDDEAYAWFIKRLNLPHEKMVEACKRGLIPVTRLMSKPQLSEYMDAFGRDYRQQGYRLTDPEMMKYEGET